MFSPNRLYWTTRGLHPRHLRSRVDSTLAVYLLAAVLFLTGSAAFWAPLPLFLTENGFNSGQVFAVYLTSSLASAVLYEAVGSAAATYDVRMLQAGALVVRGVLFPGLGFISLLGAGVVAFGVTTLGLAILGGTWAVITVIGTAIVTRLAPPSVRGEVLGTHTALGAVAGGLGAVLGGWVATYGYGLTFGLAGGLVLVGAVLVFSLRVLSGGSTVGESPTETVGDRPRPAAMSATATDSDEVDSE